MCRDIFLHNLVHQIKTFLSFSYFFCLLCFAFKFSSQKKNVITTCFQCRLEESLPSLNLKRNVCELKAGSKQPDTQFTLPRIRYLTSATFYSLHEGGEEIFLQTPPLNYTFFNLHFFLTWRCLRSTHAPLMDFHCVCLDGGRVEISLQLFDICYFMVLHICKENIIQKIVRSANICFR